MSDEKVKIGSEAVYDAGKLGIGRMLILGLQHMFAMFGATILVPIIVNDATGANLPLSIQTTLLFAGIGTLLFHVFTKFKVPAFLGSSFAFLGGFSAVSALPAYATYSQEDKLAYALGGIVIAGLLYFVIAIIIKVCGVNRVMRFLPPVVTGPIIILIGLNLAPTAVDSASTCWPIALLAIAVIIVCNIFGKGMIKIIPILLGVLVSYGAAVIVTLCGGPKLVDFAQITSADVVGLQQFTLAKFDINAILVMAPIAIATIMEHVGDMSAISATCGKNFISDPGLHRSLMGDGCATALAAMFGGPANTTYGENTGVLALSKVYDPKVVRLAALYAIVLSFSPIFAGVIGAMPSSVVGGVSFILYGMISAVGVRNVVENRVDFTKSRNLIIAAVIMVCGLGFKSGVTFSIAGTDITLTSLALAALAGIVLNAILPGNDYKFGEDVTADKSADMGSY
ncbi:MAG: uracil-xanthine permease [Lachnospiraceae bacterium]|nr:uracil-xanthine permease [Lachnospiraceae bacterium]